MNLMQGLIHGLSGGVNAYNDQSQRDELLELKRLAMQQQQEQMRWQQQQQERAQNQEMANKTAMFKALNPQRAMEISGTGNRDVSRMSALPDTDSQIKLNEIMNPKPEWAIEEMEGPDGPGKYIIDKRSGRAQKLGGIVNKGGTIIDFIDRNFPNATPEQKLQMLERHQSAGKTSINIDNGLTKGAAGQFQTDIVEQQDLINGLDQAFSLWKPNYSTYKAKFGAAIDDVATKAGMPPAKGTPEYREWEAATQQAYLTYRKWATGVAGSEKEFNEILNTFPNSSDSAPVYERKMKMTKEKIRQKINERRRALDVGVDGVGSSPRPASQNKRLKFDSQGNLVE